MGLLRFLFRAVLALVVVALMTLIVYPLTAASIVFHMLNNGGFSGSDFVINLLRNIFLIHPDVIKFSRRRVGKIIDGKEPAP